MSVTRADRTRRRILDAAERLFRERGLDGVGLEAVAGAAGVSRQAVYDKFGSKGGLLRALTLEVEGRLGIPQVVGELDSAPDGLTMLRALLQLNRTSEPGVAPFVRVLYAARLHDDTAAELLDERLSARHRAMGKVVQALAREGRLRPGLSVERGTDMLWSILNPLHYDNLVATRGWTPAEYGQHVETLVRSALLGEAPQPWS